MKAWREHTVRQLFHKTKTRATNVTTALVLTASSLGGALPLLAANHASALALGTTELRLSSAVPATIEAGTSAASFSVKEVVGLGGNGWSNVLTGFSPATVTATVTNGQIATNCSVSPVWGTAATVTVSPVGNVVEGTFCYKSNTVGNHDISLVASGHFPLLGNIHNVLTVPVTVADTTAPSVPVNGQPSGGIYKNTNVFDYTWDASTDNSDGVITYEYQASQNPHTTGGVLDTSVWNNVVNHVNSSQYPLTSALIPSVGTSDGTWYWQVRAIDASHNTSSWSQVWSYTLDSQAPTLNVTSPNDGAYVNGSFTVKASASDSDGLNAYYVSVDGVGKGYTYHPANGNIPDVTIDTTTFSEGPHTLLVRVTDLAGNAAEVHRTFTVDRTAPTVNVTPVAGSLLHGTETFDITVNDSNPLDINKNKSVWVYLYDTAGSQKSQGAKVDLSSGHGTFTVDTTKLNDGNANLDIAIVHDAAGNASGNTDNYFRNYTIDNSGPVVTINTPGSSVATKDDSVSVSVTATDNHELNTLSVYLTDGSGHYVTTCTSASNLYAYPAWATSYTADCALDVSGLADGTYTLIAKSQDHAGNYSNTATRSITIDRTAPATPALVTPGDGATVKASEATLDWSDVTDAHGPVAYEYQSAYSADVNGSNNGLTNAIYDATTGNTSQIDATASADGTYYWQVRACDVLGNCSDWSGPWAVTIDGTAPKVAVDTNPSEGATVASGTVTITGTVSDTNFAEYRYQLLDQNKQPITNSIIGGHSPVLNGTLGTFDLEHMPSQTIDPTLRGQQLPDGTYYVRVWAKDLAGNQTGNKNVPYVATFTVKRLVGGLGGANNTSQPAFKASALAAPASNTATTTAAPSTDGDSTDVLGTSTTDDSSDDNGKVKGISTTASDVKDAKSNRFLGLGWWWLAVLALIAALWLAFMRRRSEEQ